MGLDGRCLDADATGWPGQVHPAQRVINLRDLAFMSISSGPKMASVIWPTRRMRSQLRTFRSGQHWLLVWNINLLYWACLTFRSIVIWNREKVLVTCCNAFQTSLRCATICLHCTTLCLNAGTVLTTTLTHKMCLWYFTSAWGKFKPLCLNSLQIAMMIFFFLAMMILFVDYQAQTLDINLNEDVCNSVMYGFNYPDLLFLCYKFLSAVLILWFLSGQVLLP